MAYDTYQDVIDLKSLALLFTKLLGNAFVSLLLLTCTYVLTQLSILFRAAAKKFVFLVAWTIRGAGGGQLEKKLFLTLFLTKKKKESSGGH